ncbi:MAG: 4Fe-4S binding protein [Elusimicrobiaceae bacterium]|nr:4Fe-4S binding protein [Elusimicrobiaceae bacterium]
MITFTRPPHPAYPALLVFSILVPLGWYTAPRGGAEFFWPVWCALVACAAYYIFKTGKMAFWRSALFITLAAGAFVKLKAAGGGFPPAWLAGHNAERIPCHIAQSCDLLFMLRTNITALVNGHGTAWLTLSGGMILLALAAFLGRSWCGWMCLYGGLDEASSGLLPASWRILARRIPAKTRYVSAVILLIFLLLSFLTFTPAFCVWLCPLKMNWSFLKLDTGAGITAAMLMTAAGLLFLFILPLLSGRRIFCGCICPFAAWQSFAGRLNPYRLTIGSACTDCGKCAAVCPVLAIDRTKDGHFEISPFCVHCGKCAEICPAGAITTTVKGARLIMTVAGYDITAQNLFRLTALLGLGVAGLAFLP